MSAKAASNKNEAKNDATEVASNEINAVKPEPVEVAEQSFPQACPYFLTFEKAPFIFLDVKWFFLLVLLNAH